MGACPERIISFKDYSVNIVGAMIKAVNVPEEWDEKPRVLVLACENDAFPALDLLGQNGLKGNPWIRVIPVRCLAFLFTQEMCRSAGVPSPLEKSFRFFSAPEY